MSPKLASRFRSLVSELIPPDQKLLCVVCYESGHGIKHCPIRHEYATTSRQDWLNNEQRITVIPSLLSHISSELCNRCRSLKPVLLQMVNTDMPFIGDNFNRQNYRELGRVTNIKLRNDCSLCICLFDMLCRHRFDFEDLRLFLYAVKTSTHLYQDIPRHTDPCPKSDICIKMEISYTAMGTDWVDMKEFDRLEYLALVRPVDDDRFFKAEPIRQDVVDIEGLKQCLDVCDRLHGGTCRYVADPWLPGSGFLLVDVWSRQLVSSAGRHVDFVALSYVWGPPSSSRRRYRANYRAGDGLLELPRTIEDAMQLTKALGKQYIWVDYLCIAQDDPAQKLAQIRQMSDIYRTAYVTIIALCGSDMDSGLARVLGSRRAGQPQLDCEVDGQRLLGSMPRLASQVESSAWNTRAWTLQEGFLSPRAIYVADHQTYFECNVMQASEAFGLRTPWHHTPVSPNDRNQKRRPKGQGELRCPVELANDFEHHNIYDKLVRKYTSRQLTNQDDALSAFSGTLQYLQKLAYSKGFLYGLPLDYFTWGLRWRLEHIPFKEKVHLKTRPEFPTWSWLGYEERIELGPMSRPDRELTTFCAWYCEPDQPKLIFRSHESGQRHLSRSALLSRPTCFDDPRSDTDWEAWLKSETQEISSIVRRKPRLFEITDTTLIIACWTLTYIPGTLEVAESDPHNVRKRSEWRRFQWIHLNDIPCSLSYDLQPNADDSDYEVMGQDNKRIPTYTIDQRPAKTSSAQDLGKTYIGSQMLALVDRHCAREEEPHGNQVHHWFLDLDIIDEKDGVLKAIRRDVIELLVPKDEPEALDRFEPRMRRIFLV